MKTVRKLMLFVAICSVSMVNAKNVTVVNRTVNSPTVQVRFTADRVSALFSVGNTSQVIDYGLGDITEIVLGDYMDDECPVTTARMGEENVSIAACAHSGGTLEILEDNKGELFLVCNPGEAQDWKAAKEGKEGEEIKEADEAG